MIKVSPLVYITLALSLTFFLISPYRLVQFICLGILFVFLISFLYALVLSRSIKAERNTEKLKLACKEHSQISFTIKNYSPLTAHILYFFDDIPFFQVFDDGNNELHIYIFCNLTLIMVYFYQANYDCRIFIPTNS